MKQSDVIQRLKQDIEIPEVVRDKANDALRQIAGQKRACASVPAKDRAARRGGANKLPRAAAILVAVMLSGTAVVAASVHYRWNHGLEQTMQIEEAKKPDIEASGIVDRPAEGSDASEAVRADESAGVQATARTD